MCPVSVLYFVSKTSWRHQRGCFVFSWKSLWVRQTQTQHKTQKHIIKTQPQPLTYTYNHKQTHKHKHHKSKYKHKHLHKQIHEHINIHKLIKIHVHRHEHIYISLTHKIFWSQVEVRFEIYTCRFLFTSVELPTQLG